MTEAERAQAAKKAAQAKARADGQQWATKERIPATGIVVTVTTTDGKTIAQSVGTLQRMSSGNHGYVFSGSAVAHGHNAQLSGTLTYTNSGKVKA